MADYRDLDVSYIIEMARRSGATIDPWWNVDLELPYDADRLPNGKTLIADSMHDRVIEVDPAGEIVWRYPPLAAPDRSSPFGFHPASVFVPGYPDNGFVDAEPIGVRWHRPPVYAFWFLVQPDLSRDELDFSLLDRQYGEVPAGISILANIAPENPVQPEGRTVAGTYLPVDEAAYRAFVRVTTVVPSASVGADVDDPEHAFPVSILPVAEGRVSIPVPEDPIVVEDLEDTPPATPPAGRPSRHELTTLRTPHDFPLRKRPVVDRNRPHHAPVPPPQICYDGEHSREPAHGVTRSETERLYDYWGKADPDALPSKHLLVYHLLDVSAVGSVLLERHPSLLRRFAGMMELDEDLARRWLLWLLAHHDIGKFAAAFQRLKPELFPEKLSDRYRYTVRHDTLGYLLWREKLFAEVFPWVEALSPLEDAILAFLRASSGHHGKPPEEGEWRSSWFRGVDVEAAVAFSRRISDLFFSHERPPVIEAADECSFASAVSRASWAIAGFAVLCDWIGSNRLWFPFQEEPMDLQEYWSSRTLPRAERAVDEAAVLPAPAQKRTSFSALFPGLPGATDVQRAADTVPLAHGPQLFVIEDLTGSGKTEAALTLAGRLLAAGFAEGIYVALPTTATADAMYSRVGAVYRRLFAPGTSPSLVLAHSRCGRLGRRTGSQRRVRLLDPEYGAGRHRGLRRPGGTGRN
jgi:CRISPR-associated endonuclease Cas3-HD